MNTIPLVCDKQGRTRDLSSALLEQRILTLNGPVNTEQAEVLTGALLYLDAQPGDAPIHLYINSPGGSVTDGLAIHDVMRQCRHPVYTYCLGQAASMGAVLLAAGARRYALPNSQVMIHQPSGGAVGKCDDIQVAAASIAAARTQLNSLLARYTGKSVEQIDHDTTRDNFMTPAQARDYGLIDEVLEEPAANG
ncbi:MAG TPA: ATP-dependent Clp protease proteolytic subunit [Candidatus Gemmiger excrementigallinarum]|uniref:ATP-dependent Clp protease proteolytic subunit n=1 Tax=Candidatus Gemmiger excrementigallinarum TaxID=2838609 RepID=A0A9D2EQB6_9FIRM|nr:ATP-dependent Clp protease proteolytic subunit [Candidatus Gemmiger excrementigallinarum]